MTSLFSYCIPCDDGAAPNPFEGVCTLTICKPRIRHIAEVGDWIAGTGSVKARDGKRNDTNLAGKLVYAMQVTEKMSMADYDGYTKTRLPGKVPVFGRSVWWRKLGDNWGAGAHRKADYESNTYLLDNQIVTPPC